MVDNTKKIIELLVDILGIEEENITLDSHLVYDLGAESIDFIDICFQFEKVFHIKKVLLSDIYPDELVGLSYSEENLNKVLCAFPYLKKNMAEIMKSEENFEPMRTVRCLVDFTQWRLENAD